MRSQQLMKLLLLMKTKMIDNDSMEMEHYPSLIPMDFDGHSDDDDVHFDLN